VSRVAPPHPPQAQPRVVRALDRALVAGLLGLYLLWISAGDLTGGLPGGQRGALALVGGGCAALFLLRSWLSGWLVRWWGATRAAPTGAILAGLIVAGAAIRLAVPATPSSAEARIEAEATTEALRMLQTGDFHPQTFARPFALLTLQVLAGAGAFLAGVSGGRWQTLGDFGSADLLVAARLLSALLGTATIALAYVAGRAYFGRRAGLLAAALLALSPLAIRAAGLATEDALAGLVSLVVLWAIGAWRSAGAGGSDAAVVDHPVGVETVTGRQYLAPAAARQMLPALLSALLVGVATGVRPSFILLVAPLLVVLWRATGRPRRVTLAGVLLAGGLGYLLAQPYAPAALPALLDAAAVALRDYALTSAGAALGAFAGNMIPAIVLLARADPLLTILGATGVPLALWRRRPADGVLLAFLIPSGALLLLHKALDPRHVLPYVPCLALLGGAAVDAAWRALAAARRPRARRRKRRSAAT
jgi:hypothetical protein